MKLDVSIVMRSRNDGSVIGETLDAVFEQQGMTYEVIHVDNESTDDTRQIIRQKNPEGPIVCVPDGQYVPGKALNAGAERAQGTVIVFLNSDAIPDGPLWLRQLVDPLADERIGAVYGRQLPHRDARPIVVRDHLSAFPPDDNRAAGRLPNESWNSFFSMANSAVRKEVLEQIPVPEDVQFSEDIKWAQQLRDRGFETPYVAGAAVRHSHNYSFAQAWSRFSGEGRADAQIFGRRSIRDSFVLSVALPVLSSVARDVAYLVRSSAISLSELGYSVRLRVAQHAGRYSGLRRQSRE